MLKGISFNRKTPKEMEAKGKKIKKERNITKTEQP